MNIAKITILLDHGYHPDKIIRELGKVDPAIARKIKLELSPKPSKAQRTYPTNKILLIHI